MVPAASRSPAIWRIARIDPYMDSPLNDPMNSWTRPFGVTISAPIFELPISLSTASIPSVGSGATPIKVVPTTMITAAKASPTAAPPKRLRTEAPGTILSAPTMTRDTIAPPTTRTTKATTPPTILASSYGIFAMADRTVPIGAENRNTTTTPDTRTSSSITSRTNPRNHPRMTNPAATATATRS